MRDVNHRKRLAVLAIHSNGAERDCQVVLDTGGLGRSDRFSNSAAEIAENLQIRQG